MSLKKSKTAQGKYVGVYYRQSPRDHEENSIEIQQDQVRKFAEEHKIKMSREFVDKGRSGELPDELD